MKISMGSEKKRSRTMKEVEEEICKIEEMMSLDRGQIRNEIVSFIGQQIDEISKVEGQSEQERRLCLCFGFLESIIKSILTRIRKERKHGQQDPTFLLEALQECSNSCKRLEMLGMESKSSLKILKLSVIQRALVLRTCAGCKTFGASELNSLKQLLCKEIGGGRIPKLESNADLLGSYVVIVGMMIIDQDADPEDILSWVDEIFTYGLESLSKSEEYSVTAHLVCNQLAIYSRNLIWSGSSIDHVVLGFFSNSLKALKNFPSEKQIEVVRHFCSALHKEKKKSIPGLLNAVITNIESAICSEAAAKGKSSGYRKQDLAIAYCLLAFYNLETEPISQDQINIINDNFALLMDDDGQFTDQHFLKELLYSILDLLTVTGGIKHQINIYKMLLCCSGSSSLNLYELLFKLKRLSHPLCFFDIDESFAKSRDFEGLVDDILRPSSSSDQDDKLYSSYTYYDEAEALRSRGQIKEGLISASKAYQIRSRLLCRFGGFWPEWRKYNYVQLVNCKIWSNPRSSSWGKKPNVVTPWKVLESFLESTYQLSTFYYLLGDGPELRRHLTLGNNISVAQGLHYFTVRFGIFLGKINQERGMWAKATRHLELVHKLVQEGHISCLKCMLKVQIDITRQVDLLSRRQIQKPVLEGKSENIFKRLNSEYPESVKDDIFMRLDSEYKESVKVFEKGKMWNHIHLNLESFYRRIYVDLCLEGSMYFEDDIHANLLNVMSLLYNGVVEKKPNLVSVISHIGNPLEGLKAQFSLEYAEIIYRICCSYLEFYPAFSRGEHCCELMKVEGHKIIDWLLDAFIISREVPNLFRKVSSLLGAICTFSAVSDQISKFFADSRLSCDELSKSQWGHYFHQASIGGHFNHLTFSHVTRNRLLLFGSEGSLISDGSAIPETTFDMLRLAPDSVNDLKQFVVDFLNDVHCSGVIRVLCISLLGASFTCLREFISSSFTHALFLSTTHPKEPLVAILPLEVMKVSQKMVTRMSNLSEVMASIKMPNFSWVSDEVDALIPEFRNILELDFTRLDEKGDLQHITTLERCQMRLDDIFQAFISEWESAWLGAVKYLFSLGQIQAECLPPFYEGCHLRSAKDVAMHTTPDVIFPSHEVNQPLMLLIEHELQVLPWENMPILRKQGVYRILSFGTMRFTVSRNQNLCSIDPTRSYFLINPSKEKFILRRKLHAWFKSKGFQGVRSKTPGPTILLKALQENDLFVYWGHSSGETYIPSGKLERLNKKLAVSVLMGCGSALLALYRDCYEQGAILSYYLGGCPAVISTIWWVRTVDAANMTMALVDDWYKIHSDDECDADTSIMSSVVKCRSYCGDRCHLGGAALVCYGVPVYIRKLEQENVAETSVCE